MRIMRRTDEGYVHTRNGIRITADQLRETIPVLIEMLEHIDAQEEEEARRKVREGEEDDETQE